MRLLSSGARDAPPRQQTLRAALAWSHQLLTPEEQCVFRRLGVFAGSFALEFAQQALADDSLDAWTVLDHLGSLVDKSLVIAEGAAVPRYRLLETARAFALEQLDAAGEAEALRAGHAAALRVAWQVHEIDGLCMPSIDWQERLLPDLDNLRAALHWACADRRRVELAAALLAHSMRFWLGVGLAAEARRWALVLRPWCEDDDGKAGHAFAIVAAMLAVYNDEAFPPALAITRLEAALMHAGSDPVRQFLMLHISYVLCLRIDPKGDRSALLARMRALEARGWSELLVRFRQMDEAQEDYLAGRTERYLAFCRADRALCLRLGAVSETWVTARHIMLAEYQADRREVAFAVGRQLFDDVRAAGRVRQNDVTLAIWMWMAAEAGDVADARRAFKELLPILRGEHALWRAGLTLAWLAVHAGRGEAAAHILGWYDAMVAEVGQGVHGPASERSRQALLQRLEAALGVEASAAARAAGAALDENAVLALAPATD